jgi:hypothetical protein
MYTDNILAVDCAWNPTGTSNNCFRIHYACTNVWIRDSWARGQFGLSLNQASTESTVPATNFVFDNFDVYHSVYINNGNATPGVGTIQNSTLHGGTFSAGPYTNGGGNSSASWDGSTVPDYSVIGAIR